MSRLRSEEEGLTLIELLVASMMSVILVGAVGSMLISAVRSQPDLSERSQAVTTVRWVLERMTREIRNGTGVKEAAPSKVAFLASVRRETCGGAVESEAGQPSIQCRVTYSCTTTVCARAETAPLVPATGAGTTLVEGLGSGNVFTWACDPGDPCPAGPGATPEELANVTYIGATLRIPNPDGGGNLTVSDGATLRTLSYID